MNDAGQAARPSFIAKLRYAVEHPAYVWLRLRGIVESRTGYDHRQWSRIAVYRELFKYVASLAPAKLTALEIAPGGDSSPWRGVGFREYHHVDYPAFDICSDRMARTFDVIIADQVFEHLRWPYRAARGVHAMLAPGGIFINLTPFLIRVHDAPVDCSRWTETGMKHLLAEAGFPIDAIKTGAWGNRECVIANLTKKGWAKFGWGRPLHNEPEFPVVIWAIAQRQAEALPC